MQHDEVIWQVIRHKHCSFMAKLETGIFCRIPYNVTGICNRSSCPLANSRYATIRDHDDVLAKVACAQDKAATNKDDSNAYYNEEACLENKNIEKELLERLAKGVYNEIYNYPIKEYMKFLDSNEMKVFADEYEDKEPEIEFVVDDGIEEEDYDIEDFDGLPVGKAQNKNFDDDEGDGRVGGKRVRGRSESLHSKVEKDEPGKKLKKSEVLVEVEHEDTVERQKAAV